jgi:hypothetical protein
MKSEDSEGTSQKKFSDPATAEGYRFIVSGYAEAKDEILRLRNANRPIPQDIAYLDWRYQQLQGAPQPLVFWVVSESGLRVGMASLIFRPYWIDGAPKFLAVLGDISLDTNLRGIGLGKGLLQFVTGYIESNLSDTIAFVMPNAAAQKSLSAAGWKTVGSLVPHVFLLNPGEKLLSLLRSKWLASCIGGLFTSLVSQLLSLKVQKGCSLQLVDRLDESFESFWRDFPKGHLVLRDRGVESLLWRFLGHPQHRMRIASVLRNGELLGYVAFEVSQGDREVLIHDIVVAKEGDVGCVVALFVLKCRELGEICAIRLVTSESHPIEKGLTRLGFVRRTSESVFQIHSVAGPAVDIDSVWALTWGDKDI